MDQPLAALLWDVDGTLAETEFDGHRRAFNRSFAEAGLSWHWDRATYTRLLAVSGGRERMAAYLQDVEGDRPDPERLEGLQRRKQEHYVALVRQGQLTLRPGVARLIGEAAAAGLAQGIVTTSGREAVEALASGLLGDLRLAFSVWVCGEDVEMKKPDPQAYRLALRGLGREGLPLDPTRVLALEDSAMGLAAAGGAGLPCLITLGEASRQQGPEAFGTARAVLESLGGDGLDAVVRRGPACPQGRVTLSYLQRLLKHP